MTDTPKLAAPFEAQMHAGRAQEYVIQQLIRRVHTAQLVRVAAVTPTAGAVGTVDVVPMVQQQTTQGVAINSPRLYRLPYLRAQGGVSAIILDPAVGDIGLAVFAERDITSVVATQQEGPAPTQRAHDAGDGLYLGGFLNGDPTQYIEFLPEAAGIEVVTPGDLRLSAEGDMTATVGGDLVVDVAGTVSVSAASTEWRGPVTFVDTITAPEAVVNGIGMAAHKHISASPGQPTGGPVS